MGYLWIFTTSTGAGFQPSTVSLSIKWLRNHKVIFKHTVTFGRCNPDQWSLHSVEGLQDKTLPTTNWSPYSVTPNLVILICFKGEILDGDMALRFRESLVSDFTRTGTSKLENVGRKDILKHLGFQSLLYILTHSKQTSDNPWQLDSRILFKQNVWCFTRRHFI